MSDSRFSITAPDWAKNANEQVLEEGSRPVLTVPGRRSGTPRRTPLTVHEVDGRRYLIGGFPAADWIRNVRAAGRGTLTVDGTTEPIRLTEIAPADAASVLRECPRTTPEGVQMMLDVGLISEPTPEAIAELAGICPAFRIDPDQ
jgi:deazaflavin-dependent oxidoreductase (nitroreductase family)